MSRTEFNIIDDKLVSDAVLLIRENVGLAKKKNIEVRYPYLISSREINKIRQQLEYGLSKRVLFLASEDREGAMTEIQIMKRKKRR